MLPLNRMFASLVSILFSLQLRLVHSSNFVPMLFVFGDSFVDTGNNNHLNTTARANHFPYGINFDGKIATGRWSDGKIITDYLASYMGAEFPPCYLGIVNLTEGANFGSAGSGILNYTHIGGEVLTFTDQVNGFVQYRLQLDALLGGRLAFYLTTKSIFYLNIGNNDVNNFVQYNNDTIPTGLRDFLLREFRQKLETLYILGARKVIITSLYALGCAPLYQKQGVCGPSGLSSAQYYNEGLLALIDQVQLFHRDLHIMYIDTYKIMLEIHQNPGNYGIFNVTSPCCPVNNATRWCTQFDTYCDAPSSYLYWDVAHPTDAFNRVAASLFWNGSGDYTYPMNVNQLVSL